VTSSGTHEAPTSLLHALMLGLVQGPTEVLPVSSSAHIALLPRLAGWSEARVDAELHNSLEAALHGGAAAALLIVERRELVRGVRELDGASLAAAALALGPPAFAGYLLERRLERRARASENPCLLAVGLALGGAVLAWADAHPGTRRLADLRPRDGLALGIAQTLALLPGVSRNGAALTAARARGFARADAHALSWRAGLPVLAGAAALKAGRLLQRGAPRDAVPALAVGAAAAFCSTLACSPLAGPRARGLPLWPYALYRVGLASVAGVSDRSGVS
jgi:undecaprenyl-diphosphatase